MSIFDSMRRVLDSKALAAATEAGLAANIQLMNEETVKNKRTVHAEFWYRTGGSKQCELGPNTSLEMTVGIFQFTIYSPENVGNGAGTKAADMIRARFNRKQWIVEPYGYINTQVANVKNPMSGAINGQFVTIVDGEFYYYHRDPDAQDFRS